jgi:hypothetical protein
MDIYLLHNQLHEALENFIWSSSEPQRSILRKHLPTLGEDRQAELRRKIEAASSKLDEWKAYFEEQPGISPPFKTPS